MSRNMYALFTLLLLGCGEPSNQFKKEDVATSAKGKLFIIGGGERTPELMERMLAVAGINSSSYVVVLPMNNEDPDSIFLSLQHDIKEAYDVPCVNFNLHEADLINMSKLDSIRNSPLIYITSGNLKKFMHLAVNTPLQDAIIHAFNNGAVIAGNSSGGAVFNKVVITGDENFSPESSDTYDKVWKGNGIYEEGLGLLNSAIVDQHFVKRSRYNRLLSALCDHPGNIGIGIDEETALLVEGQNATVIGNSQVVVFDAVDSCGIYFNHLRMHDIHMNVYTPGDVFEIANKRMK